MDLGCCGWLGDRDLSFFCCRIFIFLHRGLDHVSDHNYHQFLPFFDKYFGAKGLLFHNVIFNFKARPLNFSYIS